MAERFLDTNKCPRLASCSGELEYPLPATTVIRLRIAKLAIKLGWYRDTFVPDECVFFVFPDSGRREYNEAIYIVFKHVA